MKNEEIKKKFKNSLIKTYGVDSPMKSTEIKDNCQKAIIKKYGVSNINDIPHVIENRIKSSENGTATNIKRMLNKITDDNIIFIKHDYNSNLYHFHCKTCNDDFSISNKLLISRIVNKYKICTKCNKLKSYSSILDNIILMLKKHNINYILNNRTILHGKEIDIYLPDFKLGIEIDGLFWHSEKFKNKHYHLNKTILSKENDVKLIHIFEDEIINKYDCILNLIKSKLDILEIEINASDCNIKKIIDIDLINNFFKTNHLLGCTTSTLNFGLYYNKELISIMSLINKNADNYKIIRFANKLNYKINKAEENIISYFIDNYNPKSIIYYSNRRYDDEDQYIKLGFNLIKKIKPNYFYFETNEINRMFRSPKNKIRYEKIKSIYKIYDCGANKYELIL